MTQQAHAVQAPSRRSTPALHLPDVVRGVMMLFSVGVLAKFTVLNEHVRAGLVGWLLFLGYVGIAVAAAARIVFVDALPERDSSRRVERTRQVGVVKELVLAGAGGLMLLVPAAFLVFATSQESRGVLLPRRPTRWITISCGRRSCVRSLRGLSRSS